MNYLNGKYYPSIFDFPRVSLQFGPLRLTVALMVGMEFTLLIITVYLSSHILDKRGSKMHEILVYFLAH